MQKATELAPSFESALVVGEDINLLVLLIAHSKEVPNVFFMKPARGNKPQILYNRESVGDEIIADNVLLLHAFTGCDTTSGIFNQGKVKLLNILKKKSRFNQICRGI